MYHLRKFQTNDEYREYLRSDEQWRPLVAYIVNEHVEDISTDWGGKDKNMHVNDWSFTPETASNMAGTGVPVHEYLPAGGPVDGHRQRWVDLHDLGEHWIEIYNNGVMHFNTMTAPSGEIFDASVDSETGLLNVTVPTDFRPLNSSSWYSYDERGNLNFWNYPQDYLDEYYDLTITHISFPLPITQSELYNMSGQKTIAFTQTPDLNSLSSRLKITFTDDSSTYDATLVEYDTYIDIKAGADSMAHLEMDSSDNTIMRLTDLGTNGPTWESIEIN